MSHRPRRPRSSPIYAPNDSYINSLDKDGCTALFLACQNNHLEVVQLLLDYGANPTIPNKNGITPYTIALRLQHYPILRVLRNSGIHH